jgi:hypothetical protein
MNFFARLLLKEAHGLDRLGRSVPVVKLIKRRIDLLTILNNQTLQPGENKLVFRIDAVV